MKTTILPGPMTDAERQARFRTKRRAEGLVQITIMVPAGAVAEVQEMAAALRASPHLRPGPLRNPITGKLVRGMVRKP